MQVSVQKLSPVLLELDVEIDVERVRVEVNKAYDTLQRQARIRGFRPGRAPRKVLTQMFGARVAADVAQRLVDETYPQAVSEQKVQPVSQPAIEPTALVNNKPFTYKARVEVLPEIAEVKYEGLEAQRPSKEVADDAVIAELDKLRKEHATLEPLEPARPIQEGDVLRLDFEIVVDGEAVEDAGAKDYEVELGSGLLIPDVEKALLGKNMGDDVSVEVKMPDAHPHPQLKGKTVNFALKVQDQKQRVLPDADDEFAKDLGEYQTLDELKKELKEEVGKRLGEQADNVLAEALVRALVEANPIEVPPTLVQRQAQVTEQELVGQARRQGQTGLVSQEMRAHIMAESEMKVRAGLLMAEIAKKEGIQIGDPELEEGLKELSEQTGKNIAKLRAEYRDKQKREMLVGMILENKVLDIIESKAKIEELGAKKAE